MTTFDLWIKACEEFNTSIYKLEGNSKNNGLYSLSVTIGPNRDTGWNCMYRHTYAVWINDVYVFATTEEKTARAYWENHKKECRECTETKSDTQLTLNF